MRSLRSLNPNLRSVKESRIFLTREWESHKISETKLQVFLAYLQSLSSSWEHKNYQNYWIWWRAFNFYIFWVSLLGLLPGSANDSDSLILDHSLGTFRFLNFILFNFILRYWIHIRILFPRKIHRFNAGSLRVILESSSLNSWIQNFVIL